MQVDYYPVSTIFLRFKVNRAMNTHKFKIALIGQMLTGLKTLGRDSLINLKKILRMKKLKSKKEIILRL
jgi:hypothetical protein